jgi:hypothetical protein
VEDRERAELDEPEKVQADEDVEGHQAATEEREQRPTDEDVEGHKWAEGAGDKSATE